MVSKPNVLFLLLDGLRADKFLGEKKSSITPNLDSLLEKGTYFSQAVASASGTIPAVSSIMTSLYSHKALVKDNNLYRINTKNQNFPLEFKKNGYNTHATYQDVISFLNLNKIFDDASGYDNYSFLWKDLTDEILNKFDNNMMQEPWLYYLHLYDLHILSFIHAERKKHAPDEFFDKKMNMNEHVRIVSAIDRSLGRILAKIDLEKTLIIVTADHGSEHGAYDEELEKINAQNLERRLHKDGTSFKIAHKIAVSSPTFLHPFRKKLSFYYSDRIRKNTSKKMKPIIQSVETQNISNYRKRLIKQSARFSGDVESPLYDDRFRIPLLFVGPNIPSGKILSSQVRSIDIFPTIAELIGIPYEKNIDGQSLLPILNGEKYDIPAFLDGAVNAPKFISKEWIGIRLPAYKYFRLKNNSKNDSYLFDLKNDPNEEHNIANKNMDIVTKMEDILVKYLSGHNFKHEEIHESSDEEAKRVEKELHKLGYV